MLDSMCSDVMFGFFTGFCGEPPESYYICPECDDLLILPMVLTMVDSEEIDCPTCLIAMPLKEWAEQEIPRSRAVFAYPERRQGHEKEVPTHS